MKQELRMVALVIRHEAWRPASGSDEKPQRNFNEALRQLREVLLVSSRAPFKSKRKIYLQVFENEEHTSSLQDFLNDVYLTGEA